MNMISLFHFPCSLLLGSINVSLKQGFSCLFFRHNCCYAPEFCIYLQRPSEPWITMNIFPKSRTCNFLHFLRSDAGLWKTRSAEQISSGLCCLCCVTEDSSGNIISCNISLVNNAVLWIEEKCVATLTYMFIFCYLVKSPSISIWYSGEIYLLLDLICQ